MSKLKVGVIVGSNSLTSINRRLAEAMVGLMEDRSEANFIRIDDLPFYSDELDRDRPAAVERFATDVRGAHAILILSPEYNRSITALLKNAIDWGSRPKEANVWREKVVAISGASPGAIGTAVGQQHLRQILGTIGALVVGGEAYISFKPDLVDADGKLTNDGTRAFLAGYLDDFLRIAGSLRA